MVTETKNINVMLAMFLELTETSNLNMASGTAKAELLNKVKQLPDIARKAKEEAKTLTDNQQDELILFFGEKYFNKLRA